MDELIDRVRWEAWGRRGVEDGGRGGVCEVVGGAGGFISLRDLSEVSEVSQRSQRSFKVLRGL